MVKRKRVSDFPMKIQFDRHYIDCTKSKILKQENSEKKCKNICCKLPDMFQEKEQQDEETKRRPDEFYQTGWLLNTQWASKFTQIKSMEEKETLPIFIIEQTEMLNSPPYLPFKPCESFLDKEVFSEKICYKFHECRCKLQHCFLRNPFPTYHPETGVITSVVNYKCIKSQCSNIRREKGNYFNKTTDYQMENRNYRQIVLWKETDLEMLERDGDDNPIVLKHHLGRIVLCLNHYPVECQVFFWKFGYLPDGAQLKTMEKVTQLHLGRKKYPSGFSKHQVAREALYEQHMLPLPNPDPTQRAIYPSTGKSSDKCVRNLNNIFENLQPSTSTSAAISAAPSTPVYLQPIFENLPPSTSISLALSATPSEPSSTPVFTSNLQPTYSIFLITTGSPPFEPVPSTSAATSVTAPLKPISSAASTSASSVASPANSNSKADFYNFENSSSCSSILNLKDIFGYSSTSSSPSADPLSSDLNPSNSAFAASTSNLTLLPSTSTFSPTTATATSSSSLPSSTSDFPSTSATSSLDLNQSTSAASASSSQSSDIIICSNLNFFDSEEFYENDSANESSNLNNSQQSESSSDLDLQTNTKLINNELTKGQYFKWIALLQKRLPSDKFEIYPFSNLTDDDAKHSYLTSQVGFAIYHHTNKNATLHLFFFAADPILRSEDGKKYIEKIRADFTKKLNEQALNKGFLRLSLFLARHIPIYCNVSLVAACTAEIQTRQKNRRQDEHPGNNSIASGVLKEDEQPQKCNRQCFSVEKSAAYKKEVLSLIAKEKKLKRPFQKKILVRRELTTNRILAKGILELV